MFFYKVNSAQRFKEGFTDIINVLMFTEKNSIATQNVKQKPTRSVKTKILSFAWQNEYRCYPLKKIGQ